MSIRWIRKMWVGVVVCLAGLSILLGGSWGADRSWEGEVFPSEVESGTDETSGAKVVFITRAETPDTNLYFHQRSWLPDGSMLFFFREQENGKSRLYGFIEKTGELVRIQEPNRPVQGLPTASRHGSRIFVSADRAIWEWTIELETEPKTRVRVSERKIADWPVNLESNHGLSENSDGSRVFFGGRDGETGEGFIVAADVETGAWEEAARVMFNLAHIQCSWDHPDLVMFNNQRIGEFGDRMLGQDEFDARMWLADLSEKEPWPLFPRRIAGELMTHECWWTEDRVVVCNGTNWDPDRGGEEAHVKVVDIHTGRASILGAGAWWDGATASEIAKKNWWHCSGDPNGRFAAADNWHGDIGLFSAQSARTRILVEGHRTYGSGAHPHMGWDPTGRKLVFTSNRYGNPDVCVVEIPEDWFGDW